MSSNKPKVAIRKFALLFDNTENKIGSDKNFKKYIL